MKHRRAHAAIPALAILAAGLCAPAWAQRNCVETSSQCPNQAVTTSRIQMGGEGSISSAGAAFSTPGRLSDDTFAEADFEYTFDRSTGQLKVVVANKTTTTASLTALGFNAPSGVTSAALISAMAGNPPTGPTTTPWQFGFDRVRNDGIVEVPSGSGLPDFTMNGFGRFSFFFGNNGFDTGGTGGNPLEILAGQSATFIIQITGSTGSLTACSFTSVGSYIPPGSKIVRAIARFQAGVSGGSAFISPCGGGDLLVKMASFEASARDSAVDLEWATASEVDNAGFRILRSDVRLGETVALNESLIPALGSPVSGSSYSFTDSGAVNGKKYRYLIEDWDIEGVNHFSAPVIAKPNPPAPPIHLMSPADESAVGALTGFRWESNGRMRNEVQISTDAAFARGRILKLSARTESGRNLTASEMDRVAKLATGSAEGGVYWRVVGRDARGQFFTSATYFLTVLN